MSNGDFVKGYLCIGTYYVASIPSTGHYLKRLRASIGQIWHILTFLSVLFILRLSRPIFSYLHAAAVNTKFIPQKLMSNFLMHYYLKLCSIFVG